MNLYCKCGNAINMADRMIEYRGEFLCRECLSVCVMVRRGVVAEGGFNVCDRNSDSDSNSNPRTEKSSAEL